MNYITLTTSIFKINFIDFLFAPDTLCYNAIYFTNLMALSPKTSAFPYAMWVLPYSSLASRLALF